MRVETRWRNIDSIPALDETIGRLAEKLKRTIGRFDPERGGVELQVHIEHHPKRELYEVSGNLHLTHHHRLFAREESHDLPSVVAATFDELSRQVRTLKSRADSTKKGAAGLPSADAWIEDEEPAEGGGRTQESTAPALSRDDLARLARSVRRELRYHLSLHDLDEDRINPLGVLDEAIASALPRLQEAQGKPAAEVVLVQEAMAAVTRAVTGLLEKLGRDEISTDDRVPSVETKDRLDGASESYLAPLLEEDLRFEDLLPDSGGAPDTVAETLELEGRIDEVLGTFPLVVRNCFLLSTLENLSREQIAETLNINEEAVRNHIGEAREALRKGLDSELSPSWRKILAG